MISRYLSPAERAQCMKVGAYTALARNGLTVTRVDRMQKLAGELSDMPSNVMKAVVGLSIVLGVPSGIAAHIIGQKITGARGKERELQTTAQYYRNAAQQLGANLNRPETVNG